MRTLQTPQILSSSLRLAAGFRQHDDAESARGVEVLRGERIDLGLGDALEITVARAAPVEPLRKLLAGTNDIVEASRGWCARIPSGP